MNIEQVSNGYIVRNKNTTQIFKTLDDVLTEALMVFEGRSPTFGGGSFGKVTIKREKKNAD